MTEQIAATDRTKPALALSGGGFRASLFHLGTLLRLEELRLLEQIERIASVSGGSITAGVLAKAWPKLEFVDGRATQLHKLVVLPTREFCSRNVDKLAIFLGAALPGRRVGDVLTSIYDDHLFEKLTLDRLPDKPQFVFKATNLQTGRLFRFSKKRLADYLIGEIPNPQGVKVATAVAASSAFPPFLSPVELHLDPKLWRRLAGAELFDDPAYHGPLYLTDGGAYDNLGLESVDSFAALLVSDAGAPFAMEANAGTWWHNQAMRALDIATEQSRALRKRLLVAEAETQKRTYAYWSIDGDISAYGIGDCLRCDPARVKALARIRTRLDPFSEIEQSELINWGYALCDVALRRHAPALIGDAPAPKWPYPDHALGA